MNNDPKEIDTLAEALGFTPQLVEEMLDKGVPSPVMNAAEKAISDYAWSQLGPSAQALIMGLKDIDVVSDWDVEPNSGFQPTWPLTNVPCPNRSNHYVSFLCSGIVVVITYTKQSGQEDVFTVSVYDRKPDSQYWPDEATCRALVPKWVDLLTAALTEATAGSDESTPAGHWSHGRRRYGIKHNELLRMMYLVEVDPEGRYRCHPSDRNLPPKHVERWVRYADFLTGVRAGVDPDNMSSECLYAGIESIPDKEMLAWSINQLKETS